MQIDFLTVLISVAALAMLGVPAYLARRAGMLKADATQPLSFLLIYITQSFLILMCFDDITLSQIVWSEIVYVVLFAAGMHVVIMAVGKAVFAKYPNKTTQQKGVLAFAAAFSNCGYMGIPLVRAIFPQSPVMIIYLTMYIVVFNIANWTLGIYVITGDKKYMNLKNALINPTMLTLLVALPLFFADIKISVLSPQIGDAFNLIGNMTTPLSMFILGIKLAEVRISTLFTSLSAYVSMALKLLVMPFLTLIVLKLTGAAPAIAAALFMAAAMPTATLTVANAERFNSDTDLATKVTLGSTLFCIVTIPLISLML